MLHASSYHKHIPSSFIFWRITNYFLNVVITVQLFYSSVLRILNVLYLNLDFWKQRIWVERTVDVRLTICNRRTSTGLHMTQQTLCGCYLQPCASAVGGGWELFDRFAMLRNGGQGHHGGTEARVGSIKSSYRSGPLSPLSVSHNIKWSRNAKNIFKKGGSG